VGDEQLKTLLANEKGFALCSISAACRPAWPTRPRKGIGHLAYFGMVRNSPGGALDLGSCTRSSRLLNAVEKIVVTCTLDHKKALATYQRAGFVPYSRAERMVVLPSDFPKR
jgi:hypothetical protein